jgi:hypothetical protein
MSQPLRIRTRSAAPSVDTIARKPSHLTSNTHSPRVGSGPDPREHRLGRRRSHRTEPSRAVGRDGGAATIRHVPLPRGSGASYPLSAAQTSSAFPAVSLNVKTPVVGSTSNTIRPA